MSGNDEKSGGRALQSSSPSSSGAQASIEDLDPSNIPPPPYEDIAVQNNGVNVNAYPNEDGLLVVDIEQGASTLAGILAPQLIAPEIDSPPDYVQSPQSSGSRTQAPISLNVVIQIVGSRGDVQPFVALGRELKSKYGHRVRIATHPTFKKFVEENGLEFFSISGDPAQLMDFMVKNPGLMPKFKTIREGEIGKRRKAIFEIIEGCWKSCIEPSESHYSSDDGSSQSQVEAAPRPFIADAIIANPPSFAHVHIAQKLGIPLHMMFT
jgi:hypothetical protein